MPLRMLLAVDAGAIVAVIFGLISFIGWVMNQVNSSQKSPPPPRKRAPRDRTIQEEIDQFLSDREGKPRPDRRRDEEILTPDQVELIDEPRRKPAPTPAPKPVQQKPRPKAKPAPQKASAQRPQPPRASKPLATEQSTTTATHPARHAAQLGKDFQQQVTQAMAPRLATTVSKDLPHAVNQSVTQHLGQFSGSDRKATAAAAGRTPASIVGMLRNPDSVRAAIIVNEILSRPISQRKK